MLTISRRPAIHLATVSLVVLALLLISFRSAVAVPDVLPEWKMLGDQHGSDLGYSVCTAGDVNGDGYSDLIVGAPLYDATFTNNGRVDVYYGGPGGYSNAPDWTKYGWRHHMRFGHAVSTAGDVNGDGFHDVIIGAPGYDNQDFAEGAAFVFHGSASGLSTSAGWSYETNDDNTWFGWSVARAGDVNGDGYDDVIVGAPYWDWWGTDSGGAFVFHGSENGVESAWSWYRWVIQASALLGWSVAGGGDLNGDGYDDVLVGTPYLDDVFTNNGKAEAYLGGPGGITNSGSWTKYGWDHQHKLGYSIAGAGDVNGDGYADVVIGTETAGFAQVVLGGPDGPDDVDITYSNVGSTGKSVATAGDLDADGYADVVVGVPGTGSGAYALLWGSPSGIAETSYHQLSTESTAQYGRSVASAGDANGDGFGDLVIGGPEALVGSNRVGAVQVGFGIPDLDVPAAPLFGQELFGRHGTAIAGLDDVNGDGYDDYLLTSPGDGSPSTPGRVELYLGGQNGFGLAPSWTVWGASPGDQLGLDAAGPGDLDGDGYADFAIATGTGEVHVYHGSPTGPVGPTVLPIPSTEKIRLAWAGDVNDDGYADLLVGMPLWDSGSYTDGGKVRYYLGSETGLDPFAFTDWVHNEDGAQFGHGLSGVGDVNGDGIDDVAVGVPFTGDGGKVTVFYGSPSGLEFGRSYSGSGGEELGFSIAPAGDLNGDGFGDFVSGAPEYGAGGGMYLFRGLGAGGDPLQTLVIYSATAGSRYAETVAMAGDVDGDGLTDVLAGVPNQGYVSILRGPLPLTWDQLGGAAPGFGMEAAGVGDVNGDGFADIAIGDPLFPGIAGPESGTVFRYGGNGHTAGSDNVNFRPIQYAGSGGPVVLGGLTGTHDSAGIALLGRSAAGRTDIRLEWQVAPLLDPLGPIQTGPWRDTGAPTGGASEEELGQFLYGLDPEEKYRWRARIGSTHPFFPASRWMSNQWASMTMTHFRTSPWSATGVEVAGGAGSTSLELAPMRPNPFRGVTTASFTVPERARVTVDVHDVGGRRVARLVDRMLEPGRHETTWDGRDADGRRTGSGVYFVRLAAGETRVSRKVIRVD